MALSLRLGGLLLLAAAAAGAAETVVIQARPEVAARVAARTVMLNHLLEHVNIANGGAARYKLVDVRQASPTLLAASYRSPASDKSMVRFALGSWEPVFDWLIEGTILDEGSGPYGLVRITGCKPATNLNHVVLQLESSSPIRIEPLLWYVVASETLRDERYGGTIFVSLPEGAAAPAPATKLDVAFRTAGDEFLFRDFRERCPRNLAPLRQMLRYRFADPALQAGSTNASYPSP